jgi:hypothetical protein
MEHLAWAEVLVAIKRASREVGKKYRLKCLRFGDWLIVAMYLWAVFHDRCQSWACDRSHYGAIFRPRKLPSVSQFNRRMNHPRILEILQRLHEDLAGPLTTTALNYLDGKPLMVGVGSKDPDARRGHVLGGYAKGYKLHAWMTENRRIPLWSVVSLNHHEVPIAKELVACVPQLSHRSLTLADQNYDSHDLHKLIDQHQGRLVVNPKGSPDGKRDRSQLRRMGPARRELLRVKAKTPSLLHLVHRQRINAEGILGNLCGYGGGLCGLPPWVRRLHRVRRWVGSKIILYHIRLRVRRQLANNN